VIAFGLLLLLLDRVNPDLGGRLRGAALDVTTPIWSAVRAPFDGAARLNGDASDYFDAVDKSRALAAELQASRAPMQRAAAMAVENRQLRALLKIAEPRETLVATARLAGASSGGAVRSAVISAGSGDGVRPGQPVRAATGLIGRTLETGGHAARVLLLTDPASRIPVIVERTGQPALASGSNAPLLEVRDRIGDETPLRLGDRLVTSGDGGIFPPGIPVAVVVRTAEPPLARPLAAPQGVGLVSVFTAYLPVPPPPPAASAVPVPREAGGGRVKPASPKPAVAVPTAAPAATKPAAAVPTR
jgi:rod shape-determining protein MreC